MSSSSSKDRLELSKYTIKTMPDLSTFLPPLLPIEDPDLERIVLTHSSFHQAPKNTFDLSLRNVVEDYEKLEHVGDALLGALAAVILHDLFPLLPEGPATVMKAALISNATLAVISNAYSLPSRMRGNSAGIIMTRMSVKAQASIFEAYVAGVFYSLLGHHDHENKEENEDIDQEDETSSILEPEEGQGINHISAPIETHSLYSDLGSSIEEVEEEIVFPQENKGQGTNMSDQDEKMSKSTKRSLSTTSLSTDPLIGYQINVTEDEIDELARFRRILDIDRRSASNSSKRPKLDINSAEAKDQSKSTEDENEVQSPTSLSVDDGRSTSDESNSTRSVNRKSKRIISTTVPARYRWLAMLRIDEWLRPLFEPIAVHAFEELKEIQKSLAEQSSEESLRAPTPEEDKKAKGCAGALNTWLSLNKVSAEYRFIAEGNEWKAVCKVLWKGEEVITEAVKPNQKLAKNVAAYRACVILGVPIDI